MLSYIVGQTINADIGDVPLTFVYTISNKNPNTKLLTFQLLRLVQGVRVPTVGIQSRVSTIMKYYNGVKKSDLP